MSRGEANRNGRDRPRRELPPIDGERLRELALRYVGRFATTRAKLSDYLRRKLRERGWASQEPADIDGLVERLAELGYVDDAAFALNKAHSLTLRGYGEGRVRQALKIAGVSDDDGEEARDSAAAQAAEAALVFARRRRLGPFAKERTDLATRQKALAAMIRAGHSFTISKRLVDAEPGSEPLASDLLS
ncbi:MAG TPA: RecX family transcriptional regulator [Sphingomicrobium sp.]|nr:RecX family transcriptional regulator [Sphingomicrobium sp.]